MTIAILFSMNSCEVEEDDDLEGTWVTYQYNSDLVYTDGGALIESYGNEIMYDNSLGYKIIVFNTLDDLLCLSYSNDKNDEDLIGLYSGYTLKGKDFYWRGHGNYTLELLDQNSLVMTSYINYDDGTTLIERYYYEKYEQ